MRTIVRFLAKVNITTGTKYELHIFGCEQTSKLYISRHMNTNIFDIEIRHLIHTNSDTLTEICCEFCQRENKWPLRMGITSLNWNSIALRIMHTYISHMNMDFNGENVCEKSCIDKYTWATLGKWTYICIEWCACGKYRMQTDRWIHK